MAISERQRHQRAFDKRMAVYADLIMMWVEDKGIDLNWVTVEILASHLAEADVEKGRAFDFSTRLMPQTNHEAVRYALAFVDKCADMYANTDLVELDKFIASLPDPTIPIAAFNRLGETMNLLQSRLARRIQREQAKAERSRA